MSSFENFSERKAAQATAYLIRCAGGQLNLLKTMKLLYLSERLSIKRYGDSITGDSFMSLPNGPVLSMTLNFMNGFVKPAQEGGWDKWVDDRANHNLAVSNKHKCERPGHPAYVNDLVALSESDLECLRETWIQFKGYTRWKLVDYTHSDACPEWENPGNSSKPIRPKRLLECLGFTNAQIDVMLELSSDQQSIASHFGG